jgi:hypothetical protein
MKLFALTLTFLASTAHAQPSAPLLTCRNIEMFEPGSAGHGKFLPSDLTVVVSAEQDSVYGWKAEVSSRGQTIVEKDVSMTAAFPNDPEGQRVKELAAAMTPSLKWEQVNHIRLTIVAQTASLHDGGGIQIYELRDKAKLTLARLVTVGWGFGRCGN